MSRQFYTAPLSLYEHIQTKRKITHIDVHKSLPWILFADKDNNIIIFDVDSKRPIRGFTIQQFFQETIKIRSLKFFDTNDKKYIANYDMNEIMRIKGIPLNIRTSLIIITLEKYICFYSYILQTFVRVITTKDLDDKEPIKCELFNYLYAIIQTEDGNLNIWNLKDWNLVRVITKANLFNKQCVYFTVISTMKEENFIACANKNGNVLLVDINKKDIDVKKLDKDKSEHDNPVTLMDFNPQTNILLSFSKGQILLIDITNPQCYKKIQNFQYFKNQKIRGITINLSDCFNQFSYFIYGKTSLLMLIDLNIELIKGTKIDSKNSKNYISYTFDLEKEIFQKVGDKPIKISKATYLLNTNDYLILGTNKGIVITKFDPSNKAAIVPSPRLIELNGDESGLKYFLYSIQNNSLFESIYLKAKHQNQFTNSIGLALSSIFDLPKQAGGVINTYHRFKISFSYDFSYLSCLDSYLEAYTILKVDINEQLRHNFKAVKYGKGISLEWCPYDNIYAVTQSRNVNFNTNKSLDKKNSSISKSSSFILTLFSVVEDKISVSYEIDDIPCHKIFTGHFLGVFAPLSQIEGVSSMSIKSNFTYSISNKMQISFYSWNEKRKIDLALNEEPLNIISSDDLDYMVICFEDKYITYKLNEKTNSLDMLTMNYHSIIDCFIYESVILVFLTNIGVYFHILNEANGYPTKLFKFSDEMNNYHLKIAKKYKEKEALYTKKHFQQKLLGIYNNNLLTANCFGEVSIRAIDHVIFKIISLIQNKDYQGITMLLTTLERKMIKSVLALFKFYYNDEEEIIRKIFTQEMIDHFQLYKYYDFYIAEFSSSPKDCDREEIDKQMKKKMIRAIMTRNEKEIKNIYKLCDSQKLPFEVEASRCIDRDTFFKSLLLKEKYFESYVFNTIYNLNDMNNKIITKAYERINSLQK